MLVSRLMHRVVQGQICSVTVSLYFQQLASDQHTQHLWVWSTEGVDPSQALPDADARPCCKLLRCDWHKGCLQAEDAATDMGGQTRAAVAAAEAVLQESVTAVAKQLQRAIPEAHNMFSAEDAAPAAGTADAADDKASVDVSDSDSNAEVRDLHAALRL